MTDEAALSALSIDGDEFETDYSECRALATVDPWLGVCFDMTEQRAEAVLFHAAETYRETDEYPYETMFVVPQRAARLLHDRVDLVLQADSDAATFVQIPLAPKKHADVRVNVLLNRSQADDIRSKLGDEILPSGRDWGWLVPMSENGTRLLIEQLKLALNDGVQKPYEKVEEEIDA